MSLFATILLQKPVVLPVGTVRKHIMSGPARSDNIAKGVEMRKRILDLLKDRGTVTYEIACEQLDMDRTQLFVQFKQLENAGLVVKTYTGQIANFSLMKEAA